MSTLTLLALASLSTLPAANLPQITQQMVQFARTPPLPRMAVPGTRQPRLSSLHLAALECDSEEVTHHLADGLGEHGSSAGEGNEGGTGGRSEGGREGGGERDGGGESRERNGT